MKRKGLEVAGAAGGSHAMPEEQNGDSTSITGGVTERDTLTRFICLFEGFSTAYGRCDYSNSSANEFGKLKGGSITIHARDEPLTTQTWANHLAGKVSLGIGPIDEQNQARWGAIDVDMYPIDHVDIARRAARLKMPLIVARSKSGGAHLLLFAEKPVKASRMIARLRHFASLLGLSDKVEIIPKQETLDSANGDCASWLNLPYYGGVDGLRYAVRASDGDAMSVEEFLDAAEAARQPVKWFTEAPGVPSEFELRGAPPCLQTLVQIGIGSGVRNNSAFAFGVYYKKSRPDDWQTALEDANQKYFTPPLPSDEILAVIKSLNRKDYFYKCNDMPICRHCDKPACRQKEYGIGNGKADVVLSHARELATDPPQYFITVEGREDVLHVELDELWDHAKFQKICMAKLRICPVPKKRADWAVEITDLLQKADTIPAPSDASETGMIWPAINVFLTRQLAMTRDEVRRGLPWKDETDGRVYFRSADLIKHLGREHIRIPLNKLWPLLRDRGGNHHDALSVGGVSTNLWSLPAQETSDEPLPLPDSITQERPHF